MHKDERTYVQYLHRQGINAGTRTIETKNVFFSSTICFSAFLSHATTLHPSVQCETYFISFQKKIFLRAVSLCPGLLFRGASCLAWLAGWLISRKSSFSSPFSPTYSTRTYLYLLGATHVRAHVQRDRQTDRQTHSFIFTYVGPEAKCPKTEIEK